MEKRDSNLELLRILLMCLIPIYHLMVYNGVFYLDNINSVIALVLSAGSAIPADYAFMAMSSYFLKKKEKEGFGHLKRSILLILQVIVLYIIKVVTLRCLFGYENPDYFIDALLMKGAWWYIYPYILLTMIYPLLNRIIEKCTSVYLYVITAVLGILLVYFSIRNNPNFLQDTVAFLFTYFFFGSLDKMKEKRKKVEKRRWTIIISIIIFAVCEALLITISFLAKDGGLDLSPIGLNKISYDIIIKYVVGRYNPLAVIAGYTLFFLFKNIRLSNNRVINKTASVTFYVFLLHDTIMGVFWYFGKCDNTYGYYPTSQFILWMMIFVAVSFALCFVVSIIYDNTCRRLFENITDRVWKNVANKE